MPLDFQRKKEIKQTDIGISQKNKVIENFSSNSSKEYILTEPKYDFQNIILSDYQLKEIQLAIGYEKYKELLMNQWEMNKLYPNYKGLFLNLYGESGTGKTMAAHAIAKQLKKKLVIVNYAEIESKYVGETSKNLIKIFNFALDKEAVLLFDEADALLSKRVTNMSNSTDVSVNQTKSVLLNLMNDYKGVVIFTTNFISNYDYAFMRRIPFQIKFSLPDYKQRISLWKYYLSSKMPYELDIEQIAKQYQEISGGDIANCVLMAALHAAVNQKQAVSTDDFYHALNSIMQAKEENRQGEPRIVSQREVSEEYAKKQLKLIDSVKEESVEVKK